MLVLSFLCLSSLSLTQECFVLVTQGVSVLSSLRFDTGVFRVGVVISVLSSLRFDTGMFRVDVVISVLSSLRLTQECFVLMLC